MKMIVVMDPMKIIIRYAKSGRYHVCLRSTSVLMTDVFLWKKFVTIMMIAVICQMKKVVIKESVQKKIVVDANTIAPLSLILVTSVSVHEDTKFPITAPSNVKTSMNVPPLVTIVLKFVSTWREVSLVTVKMDTSLWMRDALLVVNLNSFSLQMDQKSGHWNQTTSTNRLSLLAKAAFKILILITLKVVY